MKAKEEAKRLSVLYYAPSDDNNYYAIGVVCEILKELKEWGAPNIFEESTQNEWAIKRIKFWEDVKNELKVENESD